MSIRDDFYVVKIKIITIDNINSFYLFCFFSVLWIVLCFFSFYSVLWIGFSLEISIAYLLM